VHYLRVVRSIPAVTHLSYFDVVLGSLRRGEARVDAVRLAIGQAVEELALRGEARRTRDWRNPFAYRDTTVDCLRELMRWGFVEQTPLADDAAGFDRIRNAPLCLTAEGNRVAALGASERREVIGQCLLRDYSLFSDLLGILEEHEILLPEVNDARVKIYFPDLSRAADDQDGWLRLARGAEEILNLSPEVASSLRIAPRPTTSQLADEVGRYLRRRFSSRPPKELKELTGAVNKAVAQALLHHVGFKGDWNAYDRCLRWSRDLYLANDGRHVFGIPVWVSWSAATVRREGDVFRIQRRGFADYRNALKRALIDSYQRIATERSGSASQVPLVPIFQLRETAALQCRVCDEVVDRVLGDLTAKSESVDVVVQLHLADMRDFAPSARPFRFQGQRFYYVTMHARSTGDNRPTSSEVYYGDR
jgi:hypothetical protein